MLTCFSPVRKISIRILSQWHTLLHVMSLTSCRVFVKSYTFYQENRHRRFSGEMSPKHEDFVYIHRDPSVTDRDPSVTGRDPSTTGRDPSVTDRLTCCQSATKMFCFGSWEQTITRAAPSQNHCHFIRMPWTRK